MAKPHGRFSDGQVVILFLADALGLMSRDEDQEALDISGGFVIKNRHS